MMKYTEWINKYFDKNKDLVVITGATSGIGFEYLKLFAAEKCNCLAISNEKEQLHNIAKEMKVKFGITVKTIYCDLANVADVNNLESELTQHSIKILINNAGIGIKGDFLSHNREDYEQILLINSLAPTLISHMVLPQMRNKNCGVIINVATVNVATPIPKNTVYTASKFYTWAFTLALSQENTNYNILFQTMLPGTTDTPFHTKQGAKPSALTMQPNIVAKRSLENLDKLVYIPNKIDRMFFPIMCRLPIVFRMKLAFYILQKRLGL